MGRETHGERGSVGPGGLETEITALAARQYGVVALNQLAELGVTGRAAQNRVDSGRWHRVHKGVYSLVPLALLKREAHWIAAVLACGPGAVLSHRSAAALLEIRPSAATRIDVAVPDRSGRRPKGIALHRPRTLMPDEVTVVRGIPCTTLARTALDVAAVVSRRSVERVCDQAEILDTFDLNAMLEQLERHPCHPGARKLRSVLEEHYIGSTATWSENEERFLALVRAAGLPTPEANLFIDPGDGEPAVRADFVWGRQRLVVEVDGHRTHRTRQAFETDRRRDQRLASAGWRVIRTTWRQIKYRPHELIAILTKLLSA